MKTKIRFTNNHQHSPVLTLVYSNNIYKQRCLKEFVSQLKVSSPDAAMVEFIIFASSKTGVAANAISNATLDPSTDVETISIRPPKIVEFVYQKDSGETAWRKIDMVDENAQHVMGFDVEDNAQFKSFKKSRIVGGRIIQNV